MIKFVKKSKLNYVNGVLVDKKGRVVSIDERIIRQLNLLETKVQQQDYLNAQPKAQPMPSLDGFMRESIHDELVDEIVYDTPIVDKRIEEGLAFAHEVQNAHAVEKANKILKEQLFALVEFVKADDVMVDYDAGELIEIDTPELGDPLKLTTEDILNAVLYVLDVDATVYKMED